jgi:antitoxin HicB
MSHTVDEYMKLPYTIKVVYDNDNENPGWVAEVAELPGCFTQADTFEELGEMIEDAMRGWLKVALEAGLPIPEPQPDEDYSGKFVLRLPRSLHRQLTEAAQHEGVSLNQYINVALARVVGASSMIPVSYAAGDKLPQLALREKKEN